MGYETLVTRPMHGRRLEIKAGTPVFIDTKRPNKSELIGYTDMAGKDRTRYRYIGVTPTLVPAHSNRFLAVNGGDIVVPYHPTNKLSEHDLVTFELRGSEMQAVPYEKLGPHTFANSSGLARLARGIAQAAAERAGPGASPQAVGAAADTVIRGVTKAKDRLGTRQKLSSAEQNILRGLKLLLREAREYEDGAVGKVVDIRPSSKTMVVDTKLRS